MANATIKITALPNIGNGLSTTSIFPVVANVNQTDKVTLGNVGNLILNEAGNTLEPAFLSTLAYTVANAAQPNITSVGTLTSLSVSGNATAGNIVTGGVVTATGNIRGGNLVTAGVVSTATLSVTGNANVGNIGAVGVVATTLGGSLTTAAQPNITSVGTLTTINVSGNIQGNLRIPGVANLKIGGGVDGYVLQTDGAGNLTWTAQTGGGSGNGTPGGANTQIQFNDAGAFGGNSGFTFDKTVGALAVPGNITGANLVTSGVLSVTGNANIGNIGTAGVVTATGNVRGGNINTAGVVSATGNIIGAYFIGNGSQLTDITSSRISNGNSSVNLGTINGNIVVTANSGTAQLWTFDTTGKLTAPGSIIPNANITYDLGNSTNRWRDLYLSGNTIQLGNATISTANNGNVGVSGLSEIVSIPNSITVLSNPIGTGYTDTPVIIDQVTYYLANPTNISERGTAVPATYTPTMSSGNITSITITATGSYPNSGVDWDVLNEDNMWALPQGTQMDYANLWIAIEEIETVGNPPYGVISAGVASTTTTKGTIGNITVSTGTNFSVTTSSLSSVTAPCYIGLSTEYVADTEFNDDITVVQVGWTVIVNSVEYTVTYIDPAPPANQYRITVDGAAGFVSGTSYTFTNPVPVENEWSFGSTGVLSKSDANGLVLAANYSAQIITDYGDNNRTWTFDGSSGELVLPGGSVLIDPSDDNFEVRGANAVNFEAVNVVNIYTDTSNNAYQWQFGDDGNLTLPDNGLIKNSGGNLTIKASGEISGGSTAGNSVIIQGGNTGTGDGGHIVLVSGRAPGAGGYAGNVNIIAANGAGIDGIISLTTAGGNWTFDDAGNLTLPTNNSSINYANGQPYGGGSGSGYTIPYTVDTFVANTPPGFGEITFCNFEGGNSAPATAQKLFINQSPTNEQSLGTIFQQWTSNSYRGTLSLNNGNDSQATFNISNGRIYFNPETYRGFNAGLNQIWGDDCSINQLIITNATAPVFYNTDFLVEDDVFHAKNLDTGNTHVMLNVYGSSQYNPINPDFLWNLFVSFVDNVLYDGSTLRTDTSAIRTQFYNNTGNFRDTISTQDLFQYFRFTNSTGADYFGTAPTTASQGTGATLRIRVNPNNTYTVLGIEDPGTGYLNGDNLFVAGTDLGGASPANDLTLLIDTVNGDGGVTAVSFLSGDGVYPWPSNRISDGGDDQYDTGNYLNTNLASEISYANGLPQTDSAAFGGGDYCVMYNQSFFCMVATGTGSSMNELFYSGNLGFDGDGFLNWTGLRSNQNVVANNNARYAYFDSEYLDGELTPTVGTTYNMTLDSAGINLDGFYAYYDTNVADYFFGSNNTWRVESQDNLYVQSYNDMFIQTVVNQRGTGESGPNININASVGSPGQREINATAGRGGSVNVNGGDAGGNDEIDSLGNTGGSVNINGGIGSGASASGSVNIYGGITESPVGIAGNVNIVTSAGPNGSGRVSFSTSDGNTRNWAFNPDGSTIYPTLTVTRGDRTGTLSGQTLLFGDSTQTVIISTPNGTNDINDSQRLIINPGAGYANTAGEGGDIYLYAGRGGSASGSGGDIKIRGGLGPVDGYGGYIDITGGESAGNGPGGYIEINGGQSANSTGGFVRIVGGQGISGAEANLIGGTGSAGPGGAVNIAGGTSSNGLSGYGNVNITSGASTWRFDNTGNLVLPTNDFTVNYANGDPVTFGAAALGNVTFDDVTIQGVNQLNLSAGPDYTANLAYLQVRAGDVASHIHFDTGNNEAYDLIVGNDQKFVQVSSTGNIIMSSYDGNTSYTMKLDTTGNVTFPGVLGVPGGTTTTVPVTNESGIPGGQGGSVITGTVADNPDIASVQPGWTVTGNNLTVTTTVTSVVETSTDFYTITTDTIEEGPFTYNEVYTFTSPGISNWVFANDNTLTFPRDEIANTDPYLRIEGGTNPRILSEDASLAGPANLEITASTTIFTGVTSEEIRIYPDDGEIGSTGNLELWANAGSNVAQYSWIHDTTGNLTLPTISTGEGTDEQTIVRSQRKIIPGFHYSVAIDGDTPTVVYTASDNSINSMKVTIQIQHQGLGMEFFEVYATQTGGDTYYTVNNRLQPPTIDDSTVVVDLNGSNEMEITVTINSTAATSWVTYDGTEFGIAVD